MTELSSRRLKNASVQWNDPDSWLFGAAYYFQIHKLTESKNMTKAVIGFEGVALDWYQTKEEHKQGLE